MRILVWSCALLVFLPISCKKTHKAETPAAQDPAKPTYTLNAEVARYYPLGIGTKWNYTYRDTEVGAVAQSEEATGPLTITVRTTISLSNQAAPATLTRHYEASAKGDLLLPQEVLDIDYQGHHLVQTVLSNPSPVTLIADIAPGSSWENAYKTSGTVDDMNDDQPAAPLTERSATERVTVSSQGFDINTPGGLFKGCLKLRSTESRGWALDSYYAPGIGLVRQEGIQLGSDGKEEVTSSLTLENYTIVQ
jgi:hypothetical protein